MMRWLAKDKLVIGDIIMSSCYMLTSGSSIPPWSICLIVSLSSDTTDFLCSNGRLYHADASWQDIERCAENYHVVNRLK